MTFVSLLTSSDFRQMYTRMCLIRHFEESAYRLYMEGELPGFLHSSVGQEAIAVGATYALKPQDSMASTHRGHGDTLAKGVDVRAAMAELYGKANGSCRGKGGSMHIADFAKGILGANGVVAAGLPISLGAALASRSLRTDAVVLAFFGDGAIASGAAHEAMNIASLWNLPVIFARQNNQYAESTPRHEFEGMPEVVNWAKGYGMAATRVDGNDVLAVYEATAVAVERARAKLGPSFIECETYRWYGHNIGDPGTERPREEVKAWKKKDPIAAFRRWLVEERGFTGDEVASIDAEQASIVDQAIEDARSSLAPELSEAYDHVYADSRIAAIEFEGVR